MQSLGAIEFRHLRYFMRVAQELHFGRAAEMLGVSQAPLSQQIRQLEERLGVRLFDRTTRSVTLTPAGRVLFEKTQQIFVSLEEGFRETQAAGGLSAGRLRISTVYVGLYTFMSNAMREFSQRNPVVQIDMQIHTTEEQLALLKERKIDVAFVRPPRTMSGITYREVYREGFVAVLPADSPLAAKEDLEVEDLSEENFITYSSIVGVSYQDVVLQYCRKAGFAPKVVQEVSHTMTVVVMASAGIGVGIVPSWVVMTPTTGVVYRELPKLPKAVSLVVAWREDSINPFVRDFVKCTLSAVGDIGA
ncbi:LysR substrate-binding domain-containing protein [Nitratireductor sp.]|uniref:LysR substrate-binding domain-containing protein n=1 Tax=Nitratireductor sp. TaxID=1872084 RepID=UPI0026353585|nr:LysR substrate-binding domain-containing protein [Nitratireductor sp.]MCV0380345.1 LysR family transcriptional regulator [Nitratireductor sp.]